MSRFANQSSKIKDRPVHFQAMISLYHTATQYLEIRIIADVRQLTWPEETFK